MRKEGEMFSVERSRQSPPPKQYYWALAPKQYRVSAFSIYRHPRIIAKAEHLCRIVRINTASVKIPCSHSTVSVAPLYIPRPSTVHLTIRVRVICHDRCKYRVWLYHPRFRPVIILNSYYLFCALVFVHFFHFLCSFYFFFLQNMCLYFTKASYYQFLA